MKRENFDSDEEMYFYWYIAELQERGFIKSIELQPESWELSEPIWVDYKQVMKTKTKEVPEEILKGHSYTTDVKIVWHESALGIFTTLLGSDTRKKKRSSLQYIICQYDFDMELYSHVEVKPSFDQNNMTRLAKLNQKWVYDKHGEYVNIVVPQKHFDKTFTPIRFFSTNKSQVPRTIKYKNVLTLVNFLKKNNVLEAFENKDDDILNQLF